MKTLKDIFGNKQSKKTIKNFATQLDFNSMLIIRGGDDDPDDTWPPKTGSGN